MPALLYDSSMLSITPKRFMKVSESQKTMLKVMDPGVNLRYIEERSPSD